MHCASIFGFSARNWSSNFCEMRHNQPLVEDGGFYMPAAPVKDPYEALDDLMAVVEALCPVWPQREGFTGMEQMLL
jgi:hypothetical protein